MDLLPNTIYAREAFFAYVTFNHGLTEELSAIRATRRSELRASWRPALMVAVLRIGNAKLGGLATKPQDNPD
jgi:hypothetical protein